jgi:hypothetical protein
MNKSLIVAVLSVILSSNCWAQTTSSSWLKTAGKAAVDAGVQALNPQAQATVDQAKKLASPQEKENFLVTKARGFLGEKNYETALELAKYIKSNINPASPSADKIIADAKASLANYAQQNQTAADLQKTSADVKSLFSPYTTKK